MANERSTLNQIIQIAPEATAGALQAATKRLQTTMITPHITPKIDPFRPYGFKFPVLAAYVKESMTASIAGVPSYGELAYYFSSVLQKVTPTALGTNGAYSWTFTPSSTSLDTIQTFTVEHGSAERADRFGFGIVDSLSLKFTRDKIADLSGSMIGQRLTDPFTLTALTGVSAVQTLTVSGTPTGGTFTLSFKGQTTAPIAFNATAAAVQAALQALSTIGAGNATCTGGPLPGTGVVITFASELGNQPQPLLTHTDSFTGGASPAASIANTTTGVAITPEVPALPVLPTQVDVFIDNSPGALGTTQLTRAFTVDWTINSRYNPVWNLQSSQNSWVNYVEQEPKPQIKLLVEADSQGMGFLSDMRNGTQKFIRIQATGPSIDGTNTYLLKLDNACRITNVSEYKDQGGVYAIEWTFDLMHDPGWGQAMQVVLQNTLSAL